MRRNGVVGVSFALAVALVLLIAPETSVGAGGDAISAQAPVALVAGGTTTLPETLHLDPLPPKADVVLAFDTTGSMGAAITDAKSDAANIVNGVRASIPNARVGVVDFKDYPFSPFGTPAQTRYSVSRPCASGSGCTDFSAGISTLDTLTASFAAASTNCGTLDLDFSVDGVVVTSTSVSGGASTATLNLGPVSNGTHVVRVHASPRCDGTPPTWDGTLTLNGSGDFPYRVVQPLDGSAATLDASLSKLSAWGGSDEPEAYNRAFYELRSGAGLGYATDGAPRFVVVLGDAYPHDTNQNTSFPACPNTSVTDPGTGIEGTGPLSTADVLTALKSNHTNVSFVTYNPHQISGGGVTSTNDACQKALAEYTGGSEIVHSSGTASLSGEIVGLINQAAASVETGSFSVLSGTGPSGALDRPGDWFNFDTFGPTVTPNDLNFNETITVPAGTPNGRYTFTIAAIADGLDRAHQTVVVNVGDDAVSNVNFTVDEPTLPAGIAVAPFSRIPAARIPYFSGAASNTATPYGATPYGATPFGATPFGATPYGATPWGATPFGATPYGATPYGATPFGATPWGATPFGATGLGNTPFGATPYGATDLRNPLNQVLLSQISLTDPAAGASWPLVLGNSTLAAKPLSSTTLGDVARDTTTDANGKTPWDRFRALPAKDVPFLSTLWQGIPVGAFVLGAEPIKTVPDPDAPTATTDTARAAAWATTLRNNGGCDGCTTGSETFFGLAAAGALGSTDIGSIPFGATPYGATPYGATAAGAAIRLSSMNIAGSRLAAVQLSTLGSALSRFVTCSTTFVCAGKTLGDAVAANALVPDATLGQLFDALPTTDPARQMTVNEIVAAVLPFTSYPWEQLPLQGLQDVVGTGQNAHYHVTFDLKCGITSDFRVQVKLPLGFFPVPGSSKFLFNGTAQTVADPALATVKSDGEGGVPTATQGTWNAPATACAAGGTVHAELTFAAFTGLTIGDQPSRATVTSVGIPHDATGTAPVLVTQNHEPNDDPSASPQITPDELVVGHVASSGDKDYFRLPLSGIKANSQIVAFLKVPGRADFDLTLNGPSQTALQSTPFGATSLGALPIADEKAGPNNSQTQPQTNTLSDIPFGATPWGATPFGATASGSISQTRGSDPESAAVVLHQESSGFLTIGITGYNGSFSAQPYVMRVEVIPPPPLPTCPARTGFPTTAAGAGTLPAPSSLPQSTQTLFLVNRQRMATLYGAAAADTLMGAAGAANAGPSAQLLALAQRPEVSGAVLSVDANASVRAAYGAWDANPCAPDAGNGVVRSINDLLQTYRAALPNLRYIVVNGTNTVFPQYQQTDPSVLSPELNEAQDLAFTTNGLTQGNSLYAAAAQDQVLTDGAYGAFSRITWLDHDLPLPQIPVARLVETPADITAQITAYTSSNGVLNAGSALTTGYDFLADGADATDAALRSRFSGISADSLISHPIRNAGPPPTVTPGTPVWTKDDILGTHFFGASAIPDIGALYGHYNHYAFQPAGPDPITSIDDVITTAKVANKALGSHLLFTVGCHAGLNVPDELAGASIPTDQAKYYLDWAQAYAHDSNAVYVANTGYGYGDTDTVAASERLMSLFAQRLNVGSPNIGDNWYAALTQYFATTGVYSAVDEKVMLEATFYGLPFYHFGSGTASAPGGGTAPTSDGVVESAPYSIHPATADPSSKGTLSVPHRPLEPLITKDVSVSGKQARGLWVTSLQTSDTPNVTPTQGHWIVDDSHHEPRTDFANTYWPASPGAILHVPTLRGEKAYLNVYAGSFLPGAGTTGTQRNVDDMGLQVTYSNAADQTPPLISQATAVQNPSDATQATIQVRVSDDSGALYKVAILWNDGAGAGTSTWNFVTLDQTSPGVYQKTLTGLNPNNLIEFGVEAMDRSANVAQSWDKAFNFHEIIDNGNPSVTVANPLPGQTFVLNQQVKPDLACSDAGGVSGCSANPLFSGNLDTTTVGPHTLTVMATDLAGNSSNQTIPYKVVYKFAGFDSPVDNPPVLNVVNSGQTIPLKWSLLDAGGTAVNKLQAIQGISSTGIRCASSLRDPDPAVVPLGLAGIKIDSSGYRYNWPTAKNWAGTCRRLTVSLTDGTVHPADFQFK
jgi:hypothetical protein